MERCNKPPKQKPHRPPLPSLTKLMALTTLDFQPVTASDATDENDTKDIVFSLSEALEKHYGHIYTERQITTAFRVRNIKDFFTREWAKLSEQARKRYAISSKTCWYHKTSKTAHRCGRPCCHGTQTTFPRSAMKDWPCLKHTILIGAVIICHPPCPIQAPTSSRTTEGSQQTQ